MPQIVNGYPWQGQQYNERVPREPTHSLAGAIRRATAEAAEHPGLYQATYADATTVQVRMRPALIVPPTQREMWERLIRGSHQGASNGSQ